MIGLVDYDIYQSRGTNLHPPNLEIMKLASYYKTEESQFCRLVSLNEELLDGYDKIYFFSEKRDVEIPNNFKTAKNVIFGGPAFNNGEYKPFNNTLIDFSLPKTFIYQEFLNRKYNEGVKTKEINSFLDSSYYRMYAGEERLPPPVVRTNKKIYIYDDFFCKNDWRKIVCKIEEKKPSSIKTIHPIKCYNLDDFFFIREHIKISRDNEIILFLGADCQWFNDILNKNKNFFLGDITKTSKVYIPLGGTQKNSFEYCRDLIKTLNILYLFWSKGLPIKVKYLYPKKGFINPLEELCLLIERWSSDYSSNKTIIDKVSKNKGAKKGYDLFLKFYSTESFLFTQTFIDNKDRGFWKENGRILY